MRARPFLLSLRCQGFDHLVQTALVSGCLVLVNDTFIDHRIDDWYGGAVGLRRGFLVTFLDGLDHVLDVGPHFGAKPHIVKPGFLRLAGAFPG